MGRIHVLDPHVVNQIAAGEVIERPASVVKELVENALDAGARRVDVRIADGGRSLIEVADDGWGMEADDLVRAFLPHATSKVASVEDLTHVSSLGFRGEALASIGSVARVRITSRVRDAATGWQVENREGDVGEVVPAAASPGTVVRVEGLFGHVPARRKFLRTPATESGHVLALMGRFAVAFPDVAFHLVQGSRTMLRAERPEGGDPEDRRARIGAVHGQEVARALLHVEGDEGELHLEAWVGPSSLHRADGRLEQLFLNGRHVRDRTVAHALREAYRGLLPPGGRRPVAFLFLACPPERVDVNVHPAKAEVRWREPSGPHRLVMRTLRRALEGAAPGVPIPLPATGGRTSTADAVEFAFTRGVGRPAGPRGDGLGRHRSGVHAPAAAVAHACLADAPAAPPPATSVETAPEAKPAAPAALRPLGQALGTYLVLEGEDSIVLVDQHALHERVLVDEISARLREAGALEVQRLLVPVVLRLDPADAARLLEERTFLRSLGWHVEPFGDADLAVQALPAILKRPDPEASLRDVLTLLREGEKDGADRTQLLDDAVHRLACRAAVMAGDVLDPDEVLALLARAESLDHAHTCPHGRPTRLTLPRSDLERWFHRAV
ncbi:MAG: DNA mismatch repair endonuclease MutL [Planctomycetota bacterium]|jgi:DNA mismatch repair protein MutL